MLLVVGRVTIGCFNWMMNQTFTWEMGGNHQFHPLKKWLAFEFQLHHQIQLHTPEGLTWLHMRIRYSWKFPEKPTEIGLGLASWLQLPVVQRWGCFPARKIHWIRGSELLLGTDAWRERSCTSQLPRVEKTAFPPSFEVEKFLLQGVGVEGRG